MTPPPTFHARTWSDPVEGAVYERGRPDYPAAAARVLAERLALGPGRTVADVAAGTGKLTRLLLTTGAQVIAVEPLVGMRVQLRRASPGASVTAARAELLPLRDRSVDAITVAQAFHWFDMAAATAEFRRILPPGGRLAAVNNYRDTTVSWVAEIGAILRRYERLAPRPDSVSRWRDELLASPDFGDWQMVELDHEQRFESLDDFDARFASVSSVILLDETDRAGLLAELRDVARQVDPLVMPLRTAIWVATRT